MKGLLVVVLAATLTLSTAYVDLRNFFPFGVSNGDTYLLSGDDTSSPQQQLSVPFNFFNYSHSSLWVNVNGAISFNSKIGTYTPTCAPVAAAYRMISPFWADVDTQSETPSSWSGISYRESRARRDLDQAKREVVYAFPELSNINLIWTFIVTWNNITFYRDDPTRSIRNTFQATLTTDGSHSFAIFFYNKVTWTTGQASGGDPNGLGGVPAQVGFDAGDGKNRLMINQSCTSDIVKLASLSNVGNPGVFIFKIDSTFITTPAPISRSSPPTNPMTSPVTTPSTSPPTQTTTISSSTTTSVLDPRSNYIGTPCSTDTSQAWLDIAFVIDTSSAMSASNLRALGGEIATFMYYFNIGQTGLHTTRAAILTYATNVQTRNNLADFSNARDFTTAIMKLSQYANSNDENVNVQGGLQQAFYLLGNQTSFRKKVIILIAAAYTDAGFQGAQQTSTTIKENGIDIITISFDASDGVLTQGLKNISSPGYSYVSSQSNLYNLIPSALTQINCFCPKDTVQFKVFNSQWNNYTSYADCVYGVNEETLPSIAAQICKLVSVTSSPKLEFIYSEVVPHDLSGKKKWTIGLHRTNSSSQWKWYGYFNDEYPLGNYPTFGRPPSPGDTFTYIWQYSGFNLMMVSGQNNPLPYVCESKACDASYHCVLNSSRRST